MKKKKLLRLAVLLIMIGILIFNFAGSSLGKYITTIKVAGNVSFSAELAEKLSLLEHEAERQSDGSYKLTEDIKTSNAYTLLPGLNVPKDPYVEIVGKTDIPAYLFVEVVDELKNEHIYYELNECWLKLDRVTGKKGGSVYVYTADKSAASAITSDLTVYILLNNEMAVGQKLKGQTTDTSVLSFYAYLGEVVEGSTPADVYNNIPAN